MIADYIPASPYQVDWVVDAVHMARHPDACRYEKRQIVAPWSGRLIWQHRSLCTHCQTGAVLIGLDCPTAQRNRLIQANYHTVEQVAAAADNDRLIHVRGLGERGNELIIAALARYREAHS